MSVDHKVKSQNLKTKSRGAFSMNHSNVSLSIDLQNARIGGYVEHKLVCKSKSINTLRIHARQMIVHKVLFNGEPTDFKHEEYLSTPCNIADNIRDVSCFFLPFLSSNEIYLFYSFILTYLNSIIFIFFFLI